MFSMLKRMYSNTRCVLKGFGKVSEVFEMYSGIRQGLSSSVILFIVFLDDIIDNLKLMLRLLWVRLETKELLVVLLIVKALALLNFNGRWPKECVSTY